MSLANSPDDFFRPEDKALKMLFPSTEITFPNEFDEFLNGDYYDLIDDEDNKGPFDKTDDYFQFEDITNINLPLSVGGSSIRQRSPPQPWRRGFWCLNQTRASPSRPVKVPKLNEEDRSQETLSNQQTSLSNPGSASSNNTILNKETKRFAATSNTGKTFQRLYPRPTVTREVTLSPSPTYAQLQHSVRAEYSDNWRQDFQNFHLQVTDGKMPFSPPSGRLIKQEVFIGEQSPCNGSYHANPMRDFATFVNRQDVEDTLSSIETAYHPVQRQVIDPSSVPAPLEIIQKIPDWVPKDSQSSCSSHLSHENPASTVERNSGPIWWLPPVSMVQQHVEEQSYANSATQPTARGPQLLRYQPVGIQTIQTDGLGIQYAELEAITLPPPSHFSQVSPFTTPRKSQRALSLSPSPSPSPTNINRLPRQRSPTRGDYSQNRRKSIHKNGPMKESGSQPKPPRTPKTPKTPNGGFASLDFVNFTPKDSAKLLSDVAPSGSSKTRARREQEAREKRKKLSEAALRAVRNAGGDVGVLERAILA